MRADQFQTSSQTRQRFMERRVLYTRASSHVSLCAMHHCLPCGIRDVAPVTRTTGATLRRGGLRGTALMLTEPDEQRPTASRAPYRRVVSMGIELSWDRRPIHCRVVSDGCHARPFVRLTRMPSQNAPPHQMTSSTTWMRADTPQLPRGSAPRSGLLFARIRASRSSPRGSGRQSGGDCQT